jgi:AraC-like DNA-binding protein
VPNPAWFLPVSAFELVRDRHAEHHPPVESQLEVLRNLAARAENRRTETGIPRVAMVRGKVPEHELAAVYDPMVNLILQGGKTMTIGGRTLHYDPATYFVMSVDLPAVGTILQKGPEKPYLAVSLALDPAIVATVLADAADPAPATTVGAFSVASVTPELLDAWVRMLRLMDQPVDIPVLAPVYEREVLYRVLQGPHGWMLRDIATPDTALSRVRLAIQAIRANFNRPLRVETLAEIAALSVSAFHRHFKAVTAMSPLQFQKQLRLLQARTLLVAAGRGASHVAFEVGYESASQFSREYARFFGRPPAEDAARIRSAL